MRVETVWFQLDVGIVIVRQNSGQIRRYITLSNAPNVGTGWTESAIEICDTIEIRQQEKL